MDDFNKTIIKTLAEQLTRGYQVQDVNGYISQRESPLQILVTKHINDNKELFIKEIGKVFNKKDILSEAVKEKIESDMKSEWCRKNYEKIFLDNIKQKIEEEIVKDLGVLLKNKKITVEISD